MFFKQTSLEWRRPKGGDHANSGPQATSPTSANRPLLVRLCKDSNFGEFKEKMAQNQGFTSQTEAIPTDAASNHLMGKFLTMDLNCGFSDMF